MKKGFTLIELLVVISIVALLSSIVLASLNSVRDKGRLSAGKQFSANVFHVAADQALALYDLEEGPSGATAIDRSGNNINGVLTGGVTWSTDTPGNSKYSLSFNGSTGYVISSNNLGISGNAEFTMCAWIKWVGAWIANYPSFMGNNSTGVSASGLSFTVNGGRPAVDFWSNRFRANNAITSDAWHHVCGTKTPGLISATTKLYVDGAQVPGAVEIGDTTPNITDSPAIIGRLDATRWFNGLIDNVYFFAKTLTASEIGKMYASEAPQHKLAEN